MYPINNYEDGYTSPVDGYDYDRAHRPYELDQTLMQSYERIKWLDSIITAAQHKSDTICLRLRYSENILLNKTMGIYVEAIRLGDELAKRQLPLYALVRTNRYLYGKVYGTKGPSYNSDVDVYLRESEEYLLNVNTLLRKVEDIHH